MAFPVVLPMGDHELADPVVHWKVAYKDAVPPEILILASLRSPPRQTANQSQGVTATSLAMTMDAQVALRLYEALGDRIRDMGWQQHITGGRLI
jgi:hypothetical protein